MKLMKRSKKNGGDNISVFRRGIEKAINRTWDTIVREPFSVFSDGGNWPAIDITEDEKSMNIRVDVPGLRSSDINVEVTGNLLTIDGKREEEWENQKRGGTYRHERFSGSFSRTMTLPNYVDARKIDARCENGVLVVTLPKTPGTESQKVPVKAG